MQCFCKALCICFGFSNKICYTLNFHILQKDFFPALQTIKVTFCFCIIFLLLFSCCVSPWQHPLFFPVAVLLLCLPLLSPPVVSYHVAMA